MYRVFANDEFIDLFKNKQIDCITHDPSNHRGNSKNRQIPRG